MMYSQVSRRKIGCLTVNVVLAKSLKKSRDMLPRMAVLRVEVDSLAYPYYDALKLCGYLASRTERLEVSPQVFIEYAREVDQRQRSPRRLWRSSYYAGRSGLNYVAASADKSEHFRFTYSPRPRAANCTVAIYAIE